QAQLVDDVITFMGCDISLLILRTDELQPVISIPIRILFDELSPLADIIRTYRLISRLAGDHGIGKVNVGMDELRRLYTGRTYTTGVGWQFRRLTRTCIRRLLSKQGRSR